MVATSVSSFKAHPKRDLVGVDACTDGWIAVQKEALSGLITCTVYPCFEVLLDKTPADSMIAVDIPIGMPSDGYRQCDIDIRGLLGAKRSSVFHTPVLAVLRSQLPGVLDPYERAKQLSREVTGKAISIQTMNIIPKIQDVRTALLASESARKRVFEVHPEVSFAALRQSIDGGVLHGVMSKKRKPDGREERRRLLAPIFGSVLDDALESRTKELKGAKIDDLLDAFVCLWSCERIAMQQSVTLPLEGSLHDIEGLPMAIRY